MSGSTTSFDGALTKMVIHSFADKDFKQELKELLFTLSSGLLLTTSVTGMLVVLPELAVGEIARLMV